MSADKTEWSPDTDEALKALIRATVMDAGPIAPDAIPNKVKRAIRGHATGDLDVDVYIKQVMKEVQQGR